MGFVATAPDGPTFMSFWTSDALVMDDLVLTPEEVNPLMSALLNGGIRVTAVHNHLLRATPQTIYVHVWGRQNERAALSGRRASQRHLIVGDGPKLHAWRHAPIPEIGRAASLDPLQKRTFLRFGCPARQEVPN